VGKKPEEKREAKAEDQASHDRKVEGRVFAAVNDIARETAEAKRQASAKVQHRPSGQKQGSENQEGPSELAQGIHFPIL
jgi:hypothetical protein